ncbi:Oidioi.mRNA.OKI2018_I69.chr2.g5274.t1.cds [Oikopleura dioica]|uniref:Oidioi.mRNA.OKI2018_I69.chr2.g5274.t1.cds n=1 Tax=Oikopleura dioica TaxID=34765 RepID=A0ABN7T1J2_OIKDI|nr:Oidioi.mRNA.OKI2018_I69.chr2.g5274.t1.cds [Oikopleura dioica]
MSFRENVLLELFLILSLVCLETANARKSSSGGSTTSNANNNANSGERGEVTGTDAQETSLMAVAAIGFIFSLVALLIFFNVIPALQRDNTSEWVKDPPAWRLLNVNKKKSSRFMKKLAQEFIDEGADERELVHQIWGKDKLRHINSLGDFRQKRKRSEGE